MGRAGWRGWRSGYAASGATTCTTCCTGGAAATAMEQRRGIAVGRSLAAWATRSGTGSRRGGLGGRALEHLAHVGVRLGMLSAFHRLCPAPPRCRSYGASAGAELAALEGSIHSVLATMLEVTWPVNRWPIYVFTGERVSVHMVAVVTI